MFESFVSTNNCCLLEGFMTTIQEAIERVVAEKLREYYMRGVRDAHIEEDTNIMPSILEEFDAGDFDEAPDQHVWIRLAQNILS